MALCKVDPIECGVPKPAARGSTSQNYITSALSPIRTMQITHMVIVYLAHWRLSCTLVGGFLVSREFLESNNPETPGEWHWKCDWPICVINTRMCGCPMRAWLKMLLMEFPNIEFLRNSIRICTTAECVMLTRSTSHPTSTLLEITLHILEVGISFKGLY